MRTLAVFRRISEQLTCKKYIRGENVPLLAVPHMCFFQRNFLSKMAEPFFQKLFPSGIHAHWIKMFQIREEF